MHADDDQRQVKHMIAICGNTFMLACFMRKCTVYKKIKLLSVRNLWTAFNEHCELGIHACSNSSLLIEEMTIQQHCCEFFAFVLKRVHQNIHDRLVFETEQLTQWCKMACV